MFLSTLSLRRATRHADERTPVQQRFYPRSPCGERHTALIFADTLVRFYPRSPCGERRQTLENIKAVGIVSIHALLAESDGGRARGGRSAREFLSTLSLRRATPGVVHRVAFLQCFYPRSPCGERLKSGARIKFLARFLSTLSLRRATWINGSETLGLDRFYPRSPCGERPRTDCFGVSLICMFLSTLSLRRATASWRNEIANSTVSIHALLAESDQHSGSRCNPGRRFYPRSPCGERRKTQFCAAHPHTFLSTLSLRRATAKVHKTVGHFCAYETNFMEIASSC